MVDFKKYCRLGMFASMLIAASLGHAFELTTHGAITQNAYQQSVLADPTLYYRQGIDLI